MISWGRFLIAAGAVLLLLGLILTYSNLFTHLRLGRLPGDIAIRRGNFSFYFPLTTCILLSALVSLVLYLLRR